MIPERHVCCHLGLSVPQPLCRRRWHMKANVTSARSSFVSLGLTALWSGTGDIPLGNSRNKILIVREPKNADARSQTGKQRCLNVVGCKRDGCIFHPAML